jgi:hypothetical protein
MSTAKQKSNHRRQAGSRRRGRSAFIAAPAFLNTAVVRKVLEDEGVRTFAADELQPAGRPLPQIITEGIAEADMLVALVDATARSNSVFFEIGVAQGMNKPSLLILPTNVPGTAFDLTGMPYLRTQPDDETALRFGLSRFLAAPHHGSGRTDSEAPETRPIGERVNGLLAKIRSGESVTERALMAVLTEALTDSGVEARSELHGAEDRGADIAVWSEDLSPWVGNPLRIEVRNALLTKSQAREAVRQVRRSADMASVRWVLLLYLRATEEAAQILKSSPILAMPIGDFLEQLRSSSFGEVIRRLRNETVHGVR